MQSQDKNAPHIYRIAFDGMMLALSMVLSYIETLIPFYFGAPGIKPGFANMVLLFYFKQSGRRKWDGILVTLLRILLTGFLFGNAFSILYSMSGAVLSILWLYLICNHTFLRRLYLPVMSAVSGIFHNLGQWILAFLVFNGVGLWYYFPVLMLFGAVAGILTGTIYYLLQPYLQRMMR